MLNFLVGCCERLINLAVAALFLCAHLGLSFVFSVEFLVHVFLLA